MPRTHYVGDTFKSHWSPLMISVHVCIVCGNDDQPAGLIAQVGTIKSESLRFEPLHCFVVLVLLLHVLCVTWLHVLRVTCGSCRDNNKDPLPLGLA